MVLNIAKEMAKICLGKNYLFEKNCLHLIDPKFDRIYRQVLIKKKTNIHLGFANNPESMFLAPNVVFLCHLARRNQFLVLTKCGKLSEQGHFIFHPDLSLLFPCRY